MISLTENAVRSRARARRRRRRSPAAPWRTTRRARRRRRSTDRARSRPHRETEPTRCTPTSSNTPSSNAELASVPCDTRCGAVPEERDPGATQARCPHPIARVPGTKKPASRERGEQERGANPQADRAVRLTRSAAWTRAVIRKRCYARCHSFSKKTARMWASAHLRLGLPRRELKDELLGANHAELVPGDSLDVARVGCGGLRSRP